jgi:hypothetical protein
MTRGSFYSRRYGGETKRRVPQKKVLEWRTLSPSMSQNFWNYLTLYSPMRAPKAVSSYITPCRHVPMLISQIKSMGHSVKDLQIHVTIFAGRCGLVMAHVLAAWLLGSWVWIPPEAWIIVFCFCVLSCVGRGLCDGLIACPKEPHRVSKYD